MELSVSEENGWGVASESSRSIQRDTKHYRIFEICIRFSSKKHENLGFHQNFPKNMKIWDFIRFSSHNLSGTFFMLGKKSLLVERSLPALVPCTGLHNQNAKLHDIREYQIIELSDFFFKNDHFSTFFINFLPFFIINLAISGKYIENIKIRWI